MKLASQVTDGLWHCLCPSFVPSSTALIARNASRRIINPQRLFLKNSVLSAAACQQPIRSISSSIASASSNELVPEKRRGPITLPGGSRRSREPFNLEIATVGELHNELIRRADDGDYAAVRVLVKHLIQERGERPEPRHYLSLILGNTNTREGSPEEVERLLQEMEAHNIPPDSAVYHAALKVAIASSFQNAVL